MEKRGEGSTAAPAGKPPGPPRAAAAATGTAGAGRAVGGKAAAGKASSSRSANDSAGKANAITPKAVESSDPQGKSESAKAKGKPKGKIPASFSAFDARLSEMETVLAQIKEVLPLCKPPTASATGSVSDNSYAAPAPPG